MSHSFGGYRLVALLVAACAPCYADTSVTSGTVSYLGSGTSTSTVTVPFGVGQVQTVTVSINSLTGSGPVGTGEYIGDFDWILQDNLGHQFVMWAKETCDTKLQNNFTFTLADGGTSAATNTQFDLTNGGTYAPITGCGRTGQTPVSFPVPLPNPAQSAYASSVGNATFTSIFGNGANTNPTGTWTLYTYRGSPDSQTGSFTWTLTIKPQTLTSTNTSVSASIASPILTTQTPTFTATVTSGGNPVISGTVTFTRDGGVAMGSAIAVNGSGQATTTAAALPEGTHAITATFSGGGTFAASSGALNNYVVNHPTVQNGSQFCNTAPVTLNPGQNLTGTPYPSNIVVGGVTGSNLTGSVSSVTLQLVGSTAVVEAGVELLLVDPAGHVFIPLQQTGSTTTAANNINFTLADSGSASVPNPWTTGTFSPTASTPLTSWPAPAPSATSANAAAPEGSASFASSFNGDTPNGTWSLYPITGAFGYGTASSFSGGWCLNITTSGNPASTTTVTSSQNPTLQSTNVTITATVKDANTQAVQTTGSVTFKEGTTTLASGVALNVSGQANFTYSSAVEGDHFITAFYSGGADAPSTSAPFDQRVNHPTTNPSSGVYCNTGSITLPNTGVAPFDAQPYPSDITLPFIPGTVSGFTVTTKGVTVFPQDLEMLLVSPNGTPLQNLVLLANEGGNTEANNINVTFSDSGSSLPGNLTTSGTFKPGASSTNNVSFPSPAPAAANLVYPATVGTGTLANSFSTAFSSGFGGVWELFANTIAAQSGESISGGWCMNLTITPPVAAVTKAAVGTFTQGQQGASYTISVKNNGPGSSGDTTGTNPVTVVDTLPTGLTPAATPGSGSGWTCPAAVGQVITCTNSNIVASGSTYPLLTLFANVANGATSPVTNQASVSGGGFAGVNSNQTSTTVSPAPFLSITKTPIGTFTQGGTAQWNVVVSNTAPSSVTSGTTTVNDTLPSGYMIASVVTGNNWNCSTSTTTEAICFSTSAIAGGSSFQTITINVNVPAASPVSVTNNALVYGGGDLTHTNSGNAATTFSTVSVAQVPASITINAGATQSTQISTAFATPLAVTVKDANSVVISNSSVTFTANPGGGGQSGTFASNSLAAITVTTNSSGVATAGIFNANNKVGGYTVSVTDGAAPSQNFNLTNLSGSASTVAVSSGSGQSKAINTAFTSPLVALVTDAGGNPVSGVVVTFTAPAQTAASVTFAGGLNTATTNASGLATSAVITANSHVGANYSVVAFSPGATSASFTLSNTVGAATTIGVSSGSGQSAAINTAFTNQLVALVTDAGGNPVSGVVVTFTAPAQTSASVTFAGGVNTATTNASGLATSVVITANSHVGANYSVVAASPGATSASFTLSNTAGAATTIAVSSGSGQSAAINTAFTNQLVALVTDAGGNPVSGVVVTFTAPAQTGASATFAGGVNTATTNASGLATSVVITANSHVGANYSVVAASPGATSASFTLSNTAGAATTIAVSSGSGQSAAINTAFTNQLVALVTDAGGNPVSGVVVTFTAPAQTGASATFAGGVNTATTNASGLATSVTVTANGHAGVNYSVTAAAPGVATPATFTLTNTAGAAGSIAVSSGSGQTATVGTGFAGNLVALVTDSGGNPVSGAVVTFTAPGQSGASITFAGGVNTATTNSLGLATSAAITANTHAGANYSVTASTPGAATPATFTLTNTAAAPSTVAVSSGSPQSATVLTAFSNRLVALVTDSFSNPVSGVTVTFTAPAQTGASATFAGGVITAVTNTSGLATSAVASANTHAGANYSVTASAGGATPATFTLTNTAGTAATVSVSSGSGQSATILTAFASPLVALVTDANGNPVSGVVVTFTAPTQTGASATFAGGVITATSNTSGLATSAVASANSHAGANYSVTASAGGATSANFTLTNTAGTGGGSITLISGGGQSAQINQAFTNPLVALVTDAGGNPIQGVVVTFTAPALSGASATFAGGVITATTDAQGHATSATLTANSHIGAYNVTATTPSATNSASFGLTNLVGPVANISVSSGNNQSAQVSTSFAAPLVALVTDAGGNPVNGVTVTFAPVPVAGASATLANGGMATTGANGLASIVATANATVGSYTVTASAAGAPTPATFNLSNTSGPAVVTNVTSTTANGTYGIGAVIPVTVSFSQTVNVTGTPVLALNSGGTATYTSGSGTSTLTFTYTVAAGNATAHLDAASSAALTLNGGSIHDASAAPAILTLPVGATAGSLFANKNIAIDTVSPTVISFSVLWGTQSYNVIGSPRNRLPWQISGIQVVFSKPITAGDINSLTGLPTTGFSGLGTNTLTWTITPTPIGAFTTSLAGTGPDALTDAEGNALSAGAGFTQNLKILWGDVNDDGLVNSSDTVLVNLARNQAYNQFADMDGDGVVAITDVRIVAQRNGTTLP